MEEHPSRSNCNLNEGQNENVSLSSLNEHCLLKIFEYLYIVDTVNVSLTCRKFMTVAQMAITKYKKFNLAEYQSVVNYNLECNAKCKSIKSIPLASILILLSPNIESLNLHTNLSCSTSRNVNERQIIRKFKFTKIKRLTVTSSSALKWIKTKNLEELEIRQVDLHELNNFTHRLTKLKKFTMGDISKANSFEEIYYFLKKNPKIEYLKIEDVFPYRFQTDILLGLRNLKELDFTLGKGIPDLMFLLQIEQLTVLRLGFRESFSYSNRANNYSRIKFFLKKLSEKKNLETVELRDMLFEDDDVFDALSLFNLASLHLIKPIIRVDSFYWKLARTPFLRLRRLGVYMAGIRYGDTLCLIEHLKTLERLTLVNNYILPNDTNAFLEEIKLLLAHSSRSSKQFELELSTTMVEHNKKVKVNA